MRTPVTVGVVGLGSWGPHFARIFDELPGADLRWICDLSPAATLRVRPLVRAARATASVDDLLADEALDALVIATPPSTHYELARSAVEAGKHVLVETPLALSGEHADDLVHRAERSGRIVMGGHVLVFHPAVRALRDVIDRRELGEVYYVTGQRLGPSPGRRDENVLWDLGAHDISAVLYLLRDEPVEVSARADAYLQPGVADLVSASLTFATGIRAHVQLSWLEARRTRRLTVVGSERTAVFDGMDAERRLTFYGSEIVSPLLPQEEPLRVECEHFLGLVRSSAEPVAGVREAAAVVNVLEALQRSLDREGASEAVGGSGLAPGIIRLPVRTS